MKKKYAFTIRLLCRVFVPILLLSLLLAGCREEEVLPGKRLRLRVVNESAEPVEGAAVMFYVSEIDFRTGTRQLLDTLFTDKDGYVNAEFKPEDLILYVCAETEFENNWYSSFNIEVYEQLGVNQAIVTIRRSMMADLAGKFEKKWKQTYYAINGNAPNANCGNRLVHIFRNNNLIQKVEGNEFCQFPGREVGQDIWQVAPDGNGLLLGVFTAQRYYELVEFTPFNMTLRYRTPDGLYTVVEKFEAQ
ncbi:hypothetical protein [Hugenholtzia roseola]|uniref:hypothetical protein n=1 Tax=Hugenholtzia roseola TaxID=1002 RepID=UPI00047AE7D3|nr:hypothetical protein [Hugenholtzia roseola]